MGKVAQRLDPAGFCLVYPFLDRRKHVVAIGAGLDPDLLQGQALLVNHFQRLAVLQHLLDPLVMAIFKQAGLARQQALGTAELVAYRMIDLGQLLLHQRCDHQLAVLGHDLETVVEDRHRGVHIQIALAFHPVGDRRNTLNLGQTQKAEDLDPGPTQVELPLLDRQLGRVGVGVVVVVQLFTANDDAPRHQIGGRVAALEVAITHSMAQAVDYACRPHRDPHHLDGPDSQADGAEQQQVDDQHERHAEHFVTRIKISLNPVFRAVFAVNTQCFRILSFFTIQLCTFSQNGR